MRKIAAETEQFLWHRPAITVEPAEEQASLDRHLASGDCGSPSELLRAGSRALDREEAATSRMMREKIRESLEDRRPDLSAADVFRDLRDRHAKRWGEAPNDVWRILSAGRKSRFR